MSQAETVVCSRLAGFFHVFSIFEQLPEGTALSPNCCVMLIETALAR